MKRIEIVNVSKDRIISSRALLASTFFSRLKGLLGRNKLEENEALCIKPCKSVHTYFMSFPIDVIFVNSENTVCNIIENLKPFKITSYYKEAEYVLEMAAFEGQRKNIQIGDRIDIIFK